MNPKAAIANEFSINIGPILASKSKTQAEVIRLLNDYYEKKGSDKNGVVKVVNPWEFSRWKRGAECPTHDEIKAIASVLEISPGDIVPGIEAFESKPGLKIVATGVSDDKVYVEIKGEISWSSYARLVEAMKPC